MERYDRSPDDDTGKAGTMPEAETCVRMWIAAVRWYTIDALSAANPGRKAADGGEALRDLRSGYRMLARLCEPLGADAEAMARAIEKIITRGYGAGMHPPRPKRQRKREAA